MTLPEFITYCKLSGLIKHSLQIDDWNAKVVIERDGLRLELLYNIDELGQGIIIKSSLFTSYGGGALSPSFKTIVETFFPDDIS